MAAESAARTSRTRSPPAAAVQVVQVEELAAAAQVGAVTLPAARQEAQAGLPAAVALQDLRSAVAAQVQPEELTAAAPQCW